MKNLLIAVLLLAAAAPARADSTTSRLGGLTIISIGTSGWGVKDNNRIYAISTAAASQFDSNTFWSTATVKSRWDWNASSSVFLNGGAIYFDPGTNHTSTMTAQGAQWAYGVQASTLTATTSLTVPGGGVIVSSGTVTPAIGVGAAIPANGIAVNGAVAISGGNASFHFTAPSNGFLDADSAGGNSGVRILDNGTIAGYIYRTPGKNQNYLGDRNGSIDLGWQDGGQVWIPGSLTVAGSSSMTVTGAMGVAGSTFTVANSGIVSAPSQPGIRTRLVTTQALPSTVTTQIFFGDNSCSNGCYQHNIGGYDNSVASGTFKANGTGLYAVNCTLVFTGVASGTLLTVSVADDISNTNVYAVNQRTAGSANTMEVTATGFAYLTDGQNVQCNARADTASVSAAGSLNSFMVLQKLW